MTNKLVWVRKWLNKENKANDSRKHFHWILKLVVVQVKLKLKKKLRKLIDSKNKHQPNQYFDILLTLELGLSLTSLIDRSFQRKKMELMGHEVFTRSVILVW